MVGLLRIQEDKNTRVRCWWLGIERLDHKAMADKDLSGYLALLLKEDVNLSRTIPRYKNI